MTGCPAPPPRCPRPRPPAPPPVLDVLCWPHAARLKVRTGPGREADLTPTETKLLHCLMRNAGRVLTRDALINQVWDYDYDGNNNTVDVYIRRLRQKVEPDPNDPRYIRTVRGAGYVFQAA